MIITHSYSKYFSKGVVVITTFMFLFGFLIHPILALILFIIGVISFISSEVLEIDIKKKYRNAFVFFNYSKGNEWKDLNNIKYLSIITNNETILSDNASEVGQCEVKATNYKLRFFRKASYYIEIDEFNNLDDAIKLSKK